MIMKITVMIVMMVMSMVVVVVVMMMMMIRTKGKRLINLYSIISDKCSDH